MNNSSQLSSNWIAKRITHDLNYSQKTNEKIKNIFLMFVIVFLPYSTYCQKLELSYYPHKAMRRTIQGITTEFKMLSINANNDSSIIFSVSIISRVKLNPSFKIIQIQPSQPNQYREEEVAKGSWLGKISAFQPGTVRSYQSSTIF